MSTFRPPWLLLLIPCDILFDYKSKTDKAIVDYTLPVLCIPITPFPADRLIPFAANALQCIVRGEETHKIALSPWGFVILPQEELATAIGNMHKKFGKDTHVAPEIRCGQIDRQTHRQTCSSQYFTTAVAGEVNICYLHDHKQNKWQLFYCTYLHCGANLFKAFWGIFHVGFSISAAVQNSNLPLWLPSCNSYPVIHTYMFTHAMF